MEFAVIDSTCASENILLAAVALQETRPDTTPLRSEIDKTNKVSQKYRFSLIQRYNACSHQRIMAH
jgi:hypothetical protein